MNTEDEAQIVGKILRECKNPVIVDLGAYGGEDTAWLIGACNVPPTVIAVEADPQNFARLKAAGLSAILLYGAIADKTGTCTFHVCEAPGAGRGSGSIRRPTGHLVRHGEPYTFRELIVPCFTLDDLFRDNKLDHIDLLWVDIQAAERDMIAGGRKALQRTRYLFMEAEQGEEMYDGQAMRDELFRLLPEWSEVQRFDFNTLLHNKACP
jgi:FkbM family methyltransferase